MFIQGYSWGQRRTFVDIKSWVETQHIISSQQKPFPGLMNSLVRTLETGYKVAICSRGKRLYMQINLIADHILLSRTILGLCYSDFIAAVTLYAVSSVTLKGLLFNSRLSWANCWWPCSPLATRGPRRWGSRRRSGGNCIKIALPGKWILRDHFQENMTSRRPFLLLRISFPGRLIFIQFVPGGCPRPGTAAPASGSLSCRPPRSGTCNGMVGELSTYNTQTYKNRRGQGWYETVGRLLSSPWRRWGQF